MCSPISPAGNGMKTIPMSSSRFRNRKTRSARSDWFIRWWRFTHMTPIVRKLPAERPWIRGWPRPAIARQPVVLEVQQGRQVVQDDCLAASAEPHFREMLELYGGLRAQIVTPVVRNGRVAAIVSLHQLGRTRHWSNEEIAASSRAAQRVGELL